MRKGRIENQPRQVAVPAKTYASVSTQANLWRERCRSYYLLPSLVALFLIFSSGKAWAQCNPTGNPTRYEYTINPTTMLNIAGQQFCTSQSMGTNCCGGPSYRCLDLVFNLQNGPQGEQFGANCSGIVNLMTAQGNFDALYFNIGVPNPAGNNTNCSAPISIGNNYTISVALTGNNMGQIVVDLTVVNNMGVTVFSSSQTGTAGQAVILTMCKPGFGCVEDEIVFGCCDADATMTLLPGAPDRICNGDSTSLKFTGMNGTPPYAVTVRATSSSDTSYFNVVVPTDNDGNPNMDMDTIFVKPTDTTTYCAISVEDANGCTQPLDSQKVMVIVLPIPAVDAVPSQTVCNGAQTSPVAFSGPVPGTVFNWTNNNTTIGLAALGTGNIPAFIATNATNAPVTATITVTPTFTSNGTTCTGSPKQFTITVNPSPTVQPVANQLVCKGETTTAVNFAGSVPGTVFNWTNSNTAIGLAASGSGTIPPFVAQNPGNAPLVGTIIITPTFTNNGVVCTGTPTQFTITVDPFPTVFAGFDQIVCQNQNAVLLATLGGGANSGTWTGGLGTFANPNSPGTNYTPAPAEYGTTVKLAFTTINPPGPCPAASDTVLVTINALPIVNAGADIQICKNENLDMSKLGASIQANGSGVTSGTWSTSGTGTFQPDNAFPPGATTYVPSAADRINPSVVLTLTSADPAGPCASVSDQVILFFQPNSGLVCNDNVQIALDHTGMAEIMPDDVLEAPLPNGKYLVEVFVNGIKVGNKVDCSHIGKNVVVKVTDLCTGSYCTTTVTVVDNLAPTIICTDIELICAITNLDPAYLANVLGIPDAYPVVNENCAQFTLTRIDTWVDQNCNDKYIGYLRRVWTATDAKGNKASCTQYINFVQKMISDLTLPADITLQCNSGPVNTSPQVTGVPYLTQFGMNFPIWPESGFCRLSATFSDNKLPSCDGTYDIVRTWTLYDACKPTTPTQPTTNPKYYVQIIRVSDKSGPSFVCPPDMTTSTDPLSCCATFDLPDVALSDACSRIKSARALVQVRHPITGDVLVTHEVIGTLVPFPGNNPNNPDTLAVFGFTPCLPEGLHTVTYYFEDNCGNEADCSFDLTVKDLVPPVAACDEITQIALGIDGMNFTNATTFDDGSYDVCSNVYFKARRRDTSSCQSNDMFYDQVKFCCEDIGDTVIVILRVYDAPVPPGPVPLTFMSGNYNECEVQVYIEDKLKPTCTPPASVTVHCDSFDPSLWAYGMATGTDNCCIDTITTLVNLNLFDTVCNRGTITRTFRVFDCGGQSTTCTQRIVSEYNQNYYIRFPNDWNVTECNSGFNNFGQPEFFGKDCELLGVTYTDVIYTVVPDACFKIERNWTIINWCTFDPNKPCIEVPNPNPNSLGDHPSNLVGPVVSPMGTLAPWAPSNVRISPTDLQPTNFSTFWSANANCYKYRQIIKITDKQVPVIQCPASPVEQCDLTTNDPQLWNESYWSDKVTGSHNLCEGPVDLCITATDDCSQADIFVRYLLFLDLDNNGDMETVINSVNPPPPGMVFFGNANNPNYGGGTLRAFDHRVVAANMKYQFALQTTVSGTNLAACLRWNTQLEPSKFVVPELPYGSHKIKWIVQDGCGNEKICEYTFVSKDCKAPTVTCLNGLSTNLMPTKMISIGYQFFVKDAYDNCSPSNLLIFGIRKANSGTGFPFNPDGTPQTSVVFDCSNLGFNLVEIWAMDLAGNADFCTTYIHVQDNAGVCNSNNAAVAGMLQTESGQGLEDVNVQIKVTTVAGQPPFNIITSTDQEGYFLQPNALPPTASAVIEPVKDNDPLNGVSTFDLVLINKHILGIEPLMSPYKMIAADANGNRSITTADIVELRKLILGIYTDLPGNTSWRFVDKNFSFPNPSNPFQTLFPETKEIVDPQTHQMYEDFVAVKTGDVSGNAVTSSLLLTEDRTIGTLHFDVDDQMVQAGETYTVEMRLVEAAVGYQFTLFHPGLKVVDIRPGGGMSADNFGIFPHEQALTASYSSTETVGGFAVTFRAEQSGMLSQILSLSSRITRAEAYRSAAAGTSGAAQEMLEVALRFNAENTATVAGVGFELYQNQPNPWTNRTRLGFHLPETADAMLTVYDEAGRVLFTRSDTYPRGYNSVVVDNTVLSAAGVLFYKLETAKGNAVRRMIKM
ncbi:MAG: HYR domain-containing protein [Saprospiraceae bacterium]